MLASLSIEQFQKRFFQEGCPFWFAYQVSAKADLVGKFRNDDPDLEDEKKMEYAWMQFEELVENLDYGKIKVYCKSSENANKSNAPAYTVEWGNIPAMGGRRSSYGGGQNQMGSNWQMMQFFLQEQNKLTSELRRQEMEALRLNMENQQLAAALEEDAEPDIKEKLLMEGIGAVKTWISSNKAPQPAKLGTMGQREETTSQSEPDNNSTTTDQRPLSIDQSMAYVKAITDLFPQWDRIEILKAFYNLAYNNKEFIESQLSNVIDHEA